MKAIVREALRAAPKTRGFDYAYSLASFIAANRRWPSKTSGLLNDYYFFLKNSDDICDPLRHITTDKRYAKIVIDGLSGRKITPETYAVFDTVDEIQRERLPDKCVLKPTHGSGCVIFLEHASAPLKEEDRHALRQNLSLDHYLISRELNYKFLKKKIICEELLAGPDVIKDYKLFCYGGKVGFIQVDADRARMHVRNIYDRNWGEIRATHGGVPFGKSEPAPKQLSDMLEIGAKIARHFESVRVDMYLCDGNIHVGELTHCHMSGNSAWGSRDEEMLVSRLFFSEGRDR